MARKRDGLVPSGEFFGGLDGPVQVIHDTSPQALHHFTLSDQVNALVGASEADPDLGFMARLMALCSLPRTNPGNRSKYVRRNGPYILVMNAGGLHKLPFGNLPRLLLAWVCTEAVRTQSRVLVLGKSLSEFMRALGMEPVGGGATGARTRLRNQMTRLFNASVRLSTRIGNGSSSLPHTSPTAPSFGGTQNSPLSALCGKAKLSWERSSSRKSPAARYRST